MAEEKLSSKERVDAVLNGDRPDRTPYTFWYHFGLHFLDYDAIAEAEISFYRFYLPDILKVMDDYLPPTVRGYREMDEPYDLKEFIRADPIRQGGFDIQLRALEKIHRAVGDEVYVVNTIFSPFSWLHKFSRNHIFQMMRTRPGPVKEALDIVSDNLIDYLKEIISIGIDGVFYSVVGASYAYMSEAEHDEVCKPYDLRVLEAISSAKLRILHIHGENLMFRECLDYPVEILNWSDRRTTPSLKRAAGETGKILMGGVNEEKLDYRYPSDVEAEIAAAKEDVPIERLIIAPGCAVPTQTKVETLQAVRRTIQLIDLGLRQ